MKKAIILLSLFAVQVSLFAQEYFPDGTRWTEIRLDTLEHNSWYSKIEGEWVPNFETIEYRVLGIYSNFSETFGDNSLKCVYTNCSEWTDSLSLLIVEGKINEYLNYGRRVMATVPIYFDTWDVPSPAMAYNFDWRVGMPISFIDILSTTYDHNSETAVFGIIEEINEGNFGGVRPLSYTDVNGVRFIQGIGVTTWNDGECIFGPVKPYEALSAYGAIEPEERHHRSMLVHFERNGEVLYDVWPRKGSTVEVTIDGLNYFLYLDRHEAVLTSRNNCSGEVDIPSEVSYNDETFVVKSMTHTAFHNNSELTKVRIPKTIEEIIHYYPVDPDWLDPPTGMANPIYVNPFKGCTALESIEVDEENPCLKSIDGVLFSQDGVGQYYYKTGSYSGTGLYCYPEGARQESYTIPESVEWIGGAAFPNNQYLTTLTIPNSMKHICYDAFSGCSNLTDVYCYAENAPIAWDGAFRNVPIASATLHVPAGSIEEYKTTSPWSNFGNIVALQEEPHQPQSFLEGNPIWVYKYEHIPQGLIWRDGHWVPDCWVDISDRHFTYYFLGNQKEIDGKVYTMMGAVISKGEDDFTVNHWLPVREENGIVYAFTDSLPGIIETEDNYDSRYNDEYNPMPYLQQGNECVLYNFSTNIGETLYPQNEGSTVKSFDTYQLLDGTECRVLKTNWGRYDLYEKLGFLSDDFDGIMDPFLSWPLPIDGSVHSSRLNAYYQDNVMLYKAPDAQGGLCVNDTIWTRDDAEAYASSYKANPYHEEVMSYIRRLQKANEPVAYFPEGTKWTEIRLDTLKYNSWYSKVGDDWVPNFETIEYYVQGEYTDKHYVLKKVYTNGPEWTDSLTLLLYDGYDDCFNKDGSGVLVTVPNFFDESYTMWPGVAYQFDWSVGKGLYYRDIMESNSTGEYPYYFFFGVIKEIKEGDFGGVRPLKYVDLDGKAPDNTYEYWDWGYTDTRGGRIIQGIGITEWNDGECLFGPPDPYYAGYGWRGDYKSRHYRSMLVHFERNNEVLYDVWPKKPVITESVTYTAGQMATIILPTEPDASKGKYYRLDRYEDGQIIFEQELQPQAHIPYIIVPNEDFSIDLSTLDLAGCYRDTVSVDGISFIGSYVSETFDYPDGFYIDFIDITHDCRFEESCVIGALRAYLLVRWDDPYNQGGTRVPPLNKRGIVLRDYETGITSPLGETGEATLYDLQGRMLPSKPAQGIYIKNRQKVMVK